MVGRTYVTRSLSLILVVVWVLGLVMVATPDAAAGSSSKGSAVDDNLSSIDQRDTTDDPPTRIPKELSVASISLLGIPDPGGHLSVEIVHEVPAASAIRAEIVRLGGEVLGTSPGVTLADIDPGALATLQSRVDVWHVRPPLRVDLLPDPTPPSVPLPNTDSSLLDSGDIHVTATNAAAWQSAGHRGDGMKVGIIDHFDGPTWSAALSAGAVPAPSATYCREEGTSCNLWAGGSSHGVAVAEIVHDMAPGAELYLANVVSSTDLAAAVRWFEGQGVQIITRSLVSALDGPGDGTGSVDAIVDDAIDRGMAWFNVAGNGAGKAGERRGSYWRGSWVDADGNGWLDFAPGDEALSFDCGFVQGFRWSDWQASGRTDYDIFISDDVSQDDLAISQLPQGSGSPPIEQANVDCDAHPKLRLWVKLYDPGTGTAGDVLEFMANRSEFEYWSNPYSATQPASDSANPGAVSVGAIDPAAGSSIASYSSQGPTNDGRTKPDLSAPSCLPTVSYAPDCFDGTSAATPVAAGAAALVWGAGVATTPASVANYLSTHVIDRGAAGADNVYGTGQLRLGTPPGVNEAPKVSAGSDRTVWATVPVTIDATVTDDGLPSGSLSTTWYQVSGPGTATSNDGSAVDVTVTFPTSGVYVLKLEATDGSLTRSDNVTVTATPPPTDYFVDDDDSVFEVDIDWMAAAGITKGCNPPVNNRYCPDGVVTRGQMAAFLVRALGLTDRLNDPFIDDDDSIFEADIERLAAAGITRGCNPPTNDRFCPDGKVTREQMAAFLVRAMGYTDDGGGDLFTDDDSSIFEADIDRLGTAGVTRGCNPPSNTRYCPSGNVTRGQMAAFLHRALG